MQAKTRQAAQADTMPWEVALEALRFQLNAGVEEALLETPKNRLVGEAPVAVSQRQQIPAQNSPLQQHGEPRSFVEPRPLALTQPDEQASSDARSLAAQANSLPELAAAIAQFDGCALKQDAKHTVVYDGVEDAPILVLGEAPGAQEDAVGKPFVGPAGQLLDRMLGSIGLSRDTQVLISNTVFWRPLANRKPSDADLAVCLPFVERLIILLEPKLVVLTGGIALKAMTGLSGITRHRGRWQVLEIAGREIPALPLFHPAYLLRQASHKREAWADLMSVRIKLEDLHLVE